MLKQLVNKAIVDPDGRAI